MIKRARKELDKALNVTHRRIFGHEISGEMLSFLKNLTWSLFGGVISSGVVFVMNIVAGRALGPFGFGQYTALFSVASSLSVFILLGNDSSSVRYIADKDHKTREKEIFSASFWLTVFQFAALFVSLFALDKLSNGYLSSSINFLALGTALALTLALKNLFDSYLRAFYLIKEQSFVRIASAGLAIVAFSFYFFIMNATSFTYLVYAIILSNILFIVMALFYFYRKFSGFSFEDIKLLFHYNKYMVIGTFALTIISAEQFFIGKFVGIESLGIYSAYWYGSFLVISHLCVYFNNIFWPSAIKNKNKMPAIISKLKRLTFVALPLWIICDVIFLYLIISLFGKDYPIFVSYLILFPIAAFACGAYLVAMHLLYIDKVKLSSVVSFITGFVLIGFLGLTKNLTYYLVFQTVYYVGVSLFILQLIENDFRTKESLGSRKVTSKELP